MSENVTIATHLGHAPALAHNRRDPRVVLKEDHIRTDGTFEMWLDRDPRELYQEVFGEAIKEYNKEQKRGKTYDRYGRLLHPHTKGQTTPPIV